MALTESEIRKLPLPGKPVLIGDGRNLYLKHYPSGRKTWLFRTRVGGDWRVVKVGDYPTMSLAGARERVAAMSTRALPDALTFGELLDRWYFQRIEPRYKVTKNVEVYVNRGKDSALGRAHLAQLTTAKLVDELQAYAKVAPVSANRCLSNWKLALDFAVETEAMQENPLRRTSSRVIGGEEKSRDRTLTDSEIIALWRSDLDVCKFLLVTGLRISEAKEGYPDGDLFRVDTTKNGEPHWVYMTKFAKGVLDDNRLTTVTNVQAKLRRWCERENLKPFTPHDLRRTFATRLAGLGVEPYVVEKCLNHKMQGVMAVYNRHDYADERIAAAKLWSTELERLVK